MKNVLTTVLILCSLGQYTTLIGSVWLIGWCGWHPLWSLVTLMLLIAGSPGSVLGGIKEYMTEET